MALRRGECDVASMRDPSPDRPPDFERAVIAQSRPVAGRLWGLSWPTPSPRVVTFALITAGALPPAGLAALPGGLAMLGAPRSGIILIIALLFAPALAGLAVAQQGFDAVLSRLRSEVGSESRQIVARVLL